MRDLARQQRFSERREPKVTPRVHQSAAHTLEGIVVIVVMAVILTGCGLLTMLFNQLAADAIRGTPTGEKAYSTSVEP